MLIHTRIDSAACGRPAANMRATGSHQLHERDQLISTYAVSSYPPRYKLVYGLNAVVCVNRLSFCFAYSANYRGGVTILAMLPRAPPADSLV